VHRARQRPSGIDFPAHWCRPNALRARSGCDLSIRRQTIQATPGHRFLAAKLTAIADGDDAAADFRLRRWQREGRHRGKGVPYSITSSARPSSHPFAAMGISSRSLSTCSLFVGLELGTAGRAGAASRSWLNSNGEWYSQINPNWQRAGEATLSPGSLATLQNCTAERDSRDRRRNERVIPGSLRCPPVSNTRT
jgi:hypothetical protein